MLFILLVLKSYTRYRRTARYNHICCIISIFWFAPSSKACRL